MIRVLIAEDNIPLSIHLSNIINSTNDIHVISINSNGLEAYQSIKKLNPDIVVLDLSLPGMEGIDIVKNIEEDENIKSRIIVYSGYAEYIAQLIGYKCIVAYFQKGTTCAEQIGKEIHRIANEFMYEKYSEKASDFLIKVGFKPKNVGTELIKECVLISIEKNEEKLNVLYELVGKKKGKRPFTVKGDIQGAIDKMCKYKKEEEIKRIFKLGDTETPSPKNIIPMVRYYTEKYANIKASN